MDLVDRKYTRVNRKIQRWLQSLVSHASLTTQIFVRSLIISRLYNSTIQFAKRPTRVEWLTMACRMTTSKIVTMKHLSFLF